MRRTKFAPGLELMEARMTLSTVSVNVTTPAPPAATISNSPQDAMMTSDGSGGIDFTGQTLPTNIPYYSDPIVYQMYVPDNSTESRG